MSDKSAPKTSAGKTSAGKTSVWLPAELQAAWKASGLSLADLIRRGLDAPAQEATAARLEAAVERLEKLAAG